MSCEMVKATEAEPVQTAPSAPPLNRSQILAIKDAKIVSLHVPEWNGSVCIRTMSGAERDKFEKRFDTMENLRAYVVALTCCDEDGQRIFTDADAIELGNKNASAMDFIFWKALELNRLRNSDIEELKKT